MRACACVGLTLLLLEHGAEKDEIGLVRLSYSNGSRRAAARDPTTRAHLGSLP